MAVPVTTYEGDEIQPSLSPDGDRVAFSWNGPKQDNFDIYAKLLDSGSPLRLTSDGADDSSPAWSPDGQTIAFMRGRAEGAGTLFVVPALGGGRAQSGRPFVCRRAFFPGRALAWSPDGKWLACASCTEDWTLLLISADNGTRRALTRPNEFPGTAGDVSPAFSPDGTQLAFARYLRGPAEIFLLSLNEDYTPRATARQLTFDKAISFGPAWLSDRDLLFVAGPSITELRLWRKGASRDQTATSLGSLGDNLSNPIAARPLPGRACGWSTSGALSTPTSGASTLRPGCRAR